MSCFNIYLPLDPYLAQWFIHEQGGGVPVRLPKGSVESKYLEIYLDKQPADQQGADIAPRDGETAIEIPFFKYKPPHIYNHLPRVAKLGLVAIIRNRFDVAFWTDIHKLAVLTKRIDINIEAFMEKSGIEITDTNFRTLDKRYKRMRDLYAARDRAKRSYENRKMCSKSDADFAHSSQSSVSSVSSVSSHRFINENKSDL